jgi:hypothetical protein
MTGEILPPPLPDELHTPAQDTSVLELDTPPTAGTETEGSLNPNVDPSAAEILVANALQKVMEAQRTQAQQDAKAAADLRKAENQRIIQDTIETARSQLIPGIDDNPTTNRYFKGPPKGTQPEEHEKNYAKYGKGRWGRAALVAETINLGQGGVLVPENARENRLMQRAYDRAKSRKVLHSTMVQLERGPFKRAETKSEILSGYNIDPETKRSREREIDPKLKHLPRSQRRSIAWAEKRYGKLAQEHRNAQVYLENQGEGFIKRHNVRERLGLDKIGNQNTKRTNT